MSLAAPCPACGLPMSHNPHPMAGKVEATHDAGPEWACIPCMQAQLVLMQHKHAELIRAAQAITEASRSFSEWAANNVDPEGWSGSCQNEMIRTWFGPSEFRDLAAAQAAMEATLVTSLPEDIPSRDRAAGNPPGASGPRRFLIHRFDRDFPDEHFDNEGAARLRFCQLAQSWNLRLYGEIHVDPEAEAQGILTLAAPMIDALVAVEIALQNDCARAQAGEIEGGGREFSRRVWARFSQALDDLPDDMRRAVNAKKMESCS